MQDVGAWKTAGLMLALLAAGCRLPGREGPVPQSVATCRRLSQQGVAALDRGQQQKAETLLAQAVKACPVDPEARQHYAESLWQRGAKKEAIAEMEQACQLVVEDAALWARLAQMYLDEGNSELAWQNAERAIGLDSKQATAWAARAGVWQAAGRHEQALADYLRALNYSPKERGVLLAVAGLYRRQQQPERALQTLQSVADTYSPGEEPPQVFLMLGQTYADLGRYDEAVTNFAAAVALEKPTPEMFYQLAEAELLAGHPSAAADAARQALSIQPQHPPSRQLLDRIELAQRPESTPRR